MVYGSNSPELDPGSGADKVNLSTSALVGVVIVNFYSAGHLHRCLAALEVQSRPADRVLVINNGDEDGALNFIALRYPSIQVIDQPNIGFAGANNLAIEVLRDYQWVALLNPDAFPEPNWLAMLLSAAERRADVAVFSSQLLQAENTAKLDGEGDIYHVSGLAWRWNHGRLATDSSWCGEVFSACAAAALYKVDALLDVQGFDTSYFCYFEDVDLGFRLRLRGHRCVHVPNAIVHHVGGGSSGGKKYSDFALYHGHRNLVWTYVKNMPGYLFWLLLPLHILLNVVEIIWFTSLGHGRVIWRAKRDAIKALPAVWAKRKLIQAERKVTPSSMLRHMSFWPLTLDK